jgi:hypothetical protein
MVAPNSLLDLAVWDQPPDRHIGLEVPFGTSLDDLYKETEKTVRRFSTEFATTEIHTLEK